MAELRENVSYSQPKFNWRLALADFFAWAIAVPLAVVLRFDFTLPGDFTSWAIACGLIAGAGYVLLASLLRMYSGRYVTGTFDEVLGIAALNTVVLLVGTIFLVAQPGDLPRATFVVAGGLAGAAMLTVRFLLRRFRTLRALSRQGNRTLIYGAGDAGSQLANLMQADRMSRFVPIGFLDDDPRKQHLRRSNLRVLGSQDELDRVLREHSVDTLVIAIAGVTSERLKEIDRICMVQGVRVQVIPTASEMVGGAIKLGDVSDLSEEDIMGRQPITTDEAGIAAFLGGKTILITGAGGSIGSEIARQVQRYRPARVVLLDRDESSLHETQLSIDGSGLLTSEDLALCDLRDAERVSDVLDEVRPDIVFHAAALKHLPFLERSPSEAWKTNVIGTTNLISAAEQSRVPIFVNISTDKAANPTSVLGYSKRVTERLVAAHSSPTDQWVSVRFGNVLGSRGSVVTTFRHQIANGGPVTVTHPEVKRYFMTVREAVHLVLQAAVLGTNGETLVLDMGEPVRIADIATFMIERSGREIPITYTGLRPGEKLEEVLYGEEEEVQSVRHTQISHARIEPLTNLPTLITLTDDVCRTALVELTTSPVPEIVAERS